MMIRTRSLAAAAAALVISIVPLVAHPSFSATYDEARQVKLEGAAARLAWVNPRAFLFVDVKDAAGTVTNWAVEFGNPLDLERDGWKRSTLRVGDPVSIDGVPARGLARQASARSVTLLRTGKRVFTTTAARRTGASGPA